MNQFGVSQGTISGSTLVTSKIINVDYNSLLIIYFYRLLDQTIANDSPYLVEERVKIFIAVAESSYQNADLARDFLRRRTADIRDKYVFLS